MTLFKKTSLFILCFSLFSLSITSCGKKRQHDIPIAEGNETTETEKEVLKQKSKNIFMKTQENK